MEDQCTSEQETLRPAATYVRTLACFALMTCRPTRPNLLTDLVSVSFIYLHSTLGSEDAPETEKASGSASSSRVLAEVPALAGQAKRCMEQLGAASDAFGTRIDSFRQTAGAVSGRVRAGAHSS